MTTCAPVASAGRISSAPKYALAETSAPYSESGAPRASMVRMPGSSSESRSSQLSTATFTRSPKLLAREITWRPAPSGWAAPMLVTMRKPWRSASGSSALMRVSSSGSKPPAGSASLRSCASAMVRSARHSRARTSSSPCEARVTAGSRRSPWKPLPAPMRMLFSLYARELDQLGPVRHLGLDEFAELGRIHRRDIGADGGEPLLHLGLRERVHIRLVQALHDRLGQLGRRHQREPRHDLVARPPLGECQHLGRERRAPGGSDAEPAQLAAFGLRERVRHVDEGELQRAAHRVGERLGDALVGHLDDVELAELLQHRD